MTTTVCWRSTLYLQQRLSSSSSSTPIRMRLRSRCSQTSRIKSLALSSSFATSRTETDLNAKVEHANLDDQNHHETIKKKPTIVVVRQQQPRASNAQPFHRVKLTPFINQHQHQLQQQQLSNNNEPAAVAVAEASVPRATCAAPRSFVRIKPVVVAVPKQSTVAVDADAALMMESSSSSLLMRHNQQRDNSHQQTRRQEQGQHQHQHQYRRHGKNKNKNCINKHNNNTNSYSSPTVPFPTSCWVQVDGISPLSSLDAILASVQTVLQQQQQQANGGILLDLDGDNCNNDCPSWIERARVILSPFARPHGWFLKFRNRSIVQALLTHAARHNHSIQSGWKIVNIKECKDDDKDNDDKEKLIVSDATLRIENCSHDTTSYDLVNIFSRFDLAVRRTSSSSSFFFPSVQEWQGTTPEGKLAPPGTFLVHFADASWARAALREKQGMVFKGRQLRLAQYPRQI